MQQRERRVKILKILFDICFFAIIVVTVDQVSIVRRVIAIDEPPLCGTASGAFNTNRLKANKHTSARKRKSPGVIQQQMYYALPRKLRRSQHVRLGCGWWSKVTVYRPLPGGYVYPPTAPAAEMSGLGILSYGNDHHVAYIRRCKIICVIAMHGGYENGDKTFERIEHGICYTGNSCAKRHRDLVEH